MLEFSTSRVQLASIFNTKTAEKRRVEASMTEHATLAFLPKDFPNVGGRLWNGVLGLSQVAMPGVISPSRGCYVEAVTMLMANHRVYCQSRSKFAELGKYFKSSIQQ